MTNFIQLVAINVLPHYWYWFCFDGNLRRSQTKPKVQNDVLKELLYADDKDKNASSEAKMKRSMDQVS